MRLIDADFIIMFRDVINAVPTAAEIVNPEDTEE